MTDPITAKVATAAGASVGAAFAVLGIPLGALAAALLGAGFSYLPRGAAPHDKVPLRVLGVIADAFIGGWVAVALVHVPYTASHIGAWDSAPVVFAGLLGFLMQAIRMKTAGYFERAFQTGLNVAAGFLGKGKSE